MESADQAVLLEPEEMSRMRATWWSWIAALALAGCQTLRREKPQPVASPPAPAGDRHAETHAAAAATSTTGPGFKSCVPTLSPAPRYPDHRRARGPPPVRLTINCWRPAGSCARSGWRTWERVIAGCR